MKHYINFSKDSYANQIFLSYNNKNITFDDYDWEKWR